MCYGSASQNKLDLHIFSALRLAYDENRLALPNEVDIDLDHNGKLIKYWLNTESVKEIFMCETTRKGNGLMPQTYKYVDMIYTDLYTWHVLTVAFPLIYTPVVSY